MMVITTRVIVIVETKATIKKVKIIMDIHQIVEIKKETEIVVIEIAATAMTVITTVIVVIDIIIIARKVSDLNT